jgi:AcrR family transcriptional regulator
VNLSADPSAPAARTQRPRVEGSREEEIFDATLALLLESGYDRLTLDAVATRSRASKATLYRRWSGKADLVVDAIAQIKGELPEVPDTGTLTGDLAALAHGSHQGNGVDGQSFDIMCSLATAIHRDAELRGALLTRFLAPRQALLLKILARARDRGEIRADADLELIGDILPALLLYRVSFTDMSDLPALATQVTAQIILPCLRPDSG